MTARVTTLGVEVIAGRARLEGGGVVRVEGGPDGATERFEAPRIVLCAGSAPGVLPGVTPDGDAIITSTDALDLDRVPESVAVVGSGAVGAEFATIFNRFGAKVTVLEAAPRIFPAEEPEVDAALRGIWEREGIGVVAGDPVETVTSRDGRAEVRLRSGATIAAERVLVAAGRRLLSADLGCESAGVALGPRGEVLVDSTLRSTAAGVYAAGDITGRMLLAHVATSEGEAAARAALGQRPTPTPYHATPWATFTLPEVASVGFTEGRAREAGIRVAVSTASFMDNVKSRIDRTPSGFVKLVANADTRVLVGGTVVGAHAAEIIHSIGLAIHANLDLPSLQRFVFLHPSASETIFDAMSKLSSSVITKQ
jgi:dihydrolipoamide dehydrogenase